MAFRNQSQPTAGGPLGKIVQNLAAGVGLISESIQHHEEKKRLKVLEDEQSADGQTVSERGKSQQVLAGEMNALDKQDEAAWQLDDVQEKLTSQFKTQEVKSSKGTDRPSLTTSNSADGPALASNFFDSHPPTYSGLTPVRRLELPVVLTQRRPKARTRGFIRAYAPALGDVGIDQQTFLDFVDTLNKAVEPNPWIQAINLASLAVQHVPEPVSIAVSIACKMIADAASETHSRTKTNSFLDIVNEDFFKPRGLVAILMTWKPDDPSIITSADFNMGSTMANTTPETSGSFAKLKHRMQSSHGASSFQFPATAPLIFPAIDELAASTSDNPETEAEMQNTFKRGGDFLAGYMDRRAVVQWAADNPRSNLANAAPTPQFRSRYADPAHPASSGDLFAFFTGGKISGSVVRGGLGRGGGYLDIQSVMGRRMQAFEARGFGRRAEQGVYDHFSPQAVPRRCQLENRSYGAGHGDMRVGRQPLGGEAPGGLGLVSLSPITGLKKLLQKDVLYLMIVNRPTEDEMAEAMTYLE